MPWEMRRQERADFLKNLLDLAKKRRSKKRRALLLLAVACLETASPLEDMVRQQVLEAAKSLAPPNDEDEAKQIAAAGEYATDLLRYSPKWTKEQKIYSVQGLAQIGGRRAMGTIRGYLEEQDEYHEIKEGKGVHNAIGVAWTSFDKESFVREVFTHAEEIVLNQTQVSDLTPLASLSGLQQLSLDQTQVSDLTPLASLSGLQVLSLNQTPVSDLTPLASLFGLQALYLDQTQVSDLTPLASLFGLQGLWLDQTQVSDLTPLASLTGLQQLSLEQTQVSDEQVQALQAKLPELRIYR